MEKQNQLPAQARAFTLLTGMCNTQVLFALLSSNVIETLGQGPLSVEEIVRSCPVHQKVLSRTLRYASTMGVVNFADNKYSLTEVGQLFLKGTPGNFYTPATFLGLAPWRDSWNHFDYCLQTGEPAFDHVFGMPFFEYLDAHQTYGQLFHDYMTTMTIRIAPLVAEAYDFSRFNVICDVGGGQGVLLKAVLEKVPQAKGILFDLESTIKHHVMGETINRTELRAGNFFNDIPAADCLILKTVIHDWNDENSIKILTNCRQALNPGGKIILIEQVVEQPYTPFALFYDLHMQVMLGGAERTEKEFEVLLQAAGLRLNNVFPTKSPMKIIEASC